MLDQAVSFLNNRQFAQAAALADELLHFEPLNTTAMQVLALSLCGLNRRAEGIALLEQLVRLNPDDAQAYYNLGVSYQEVNASADAILAYQNCLRFNAWHADALWNLGDLYRLNEQFDQAVACFKKIIDQAERYPDVYHRLAVALHGAEQDDEAVEFFRKALDSQSSSNAALTHWEYSHLLLRKEVFEAGWRSYDQRFDAKISVACHHYAYPRWAGQSLKDKTLLIHAEQGLGDEIMFASIIPDLLSESGKVVLATHPALVRLFRQSFPDVDVRPHLLENPANVSDIHVDYQIPIGSLARFKRNQASDFQHSQPYLKADAATQKACWEKLTLFAPSAKTQLKVGVMWGSNPGHGVSWGQRRAQKKSIPVDLLQPLAAVPNTLFVSLQNHEVGHEAAFAPVLNLIDFRHNLLDMADTAALVANMDVIVSVDTSIAHLAGAMGKPVLIPLMHHADWRWAKTGERSVWYDSARLFRQTQPGQWQPVIEKIVQELCAFKVGWCS